MILMNLSKKKKQNNRRNKDSKAILEVNMSKNMNENEEVSVNPEVMAGVIHDYYNSGIKLAATTIKNYLENIMNSREDAITLCNKMIEDANQTIAEIHEKLGVED